MIFFQLPLLLAKEEEVVQQVGHHYIVKYYETYESTDKVFICMEFLTGGEFKVRSIDD